MGIMDYLTKSRCEPLVEAAAPITEMTSEEYCKISREYREKAIEAMRIDFETRVKEKKFCVGDVVRIDFEHMPSVIQSFTIQNNPYPFDPLRMRIKHIVDFEGIQYLKVDITGPNDYVSSGDKRRILYVMYFPSHVVSADWEDNKPTRC